MALGFMFDVSIKFLFQIFSTCRTDVTISSLRSICIGQSEQRKCSHRVRRTRKDVHVSIKSAILRRKKAMQGAWKRLKSPDCVWLVLGQQDCL